MFHIYIHRRAGKGREPTFDTSGENKDEFALSQYSDVANQIAHELCEIYHAPISVYEGAIWRNTFRWGRKEVSGVIQDSPNGYGF